MDQYWVTGVDGREYGPVDLSTLLSWVREGRVIATTRIRVNDTTVEAASIPELAAAFMPPPANPVPPIATVVAIPNEFKAWEFIGLAWELVKPHWALLGAMFLVLGLVGSVPRVGPFLSLLLGGPLMIGIYRSLRGLLAGRPPSFNMMFEGFDQFLPALLLVLVSGVLVALGFVALIVPGIILSIMWIFSLPLLAEREMDFWAAMTESAEITRGYRWELFGLMLANILILILGLLACCVGVFVAQAVTWTSIAIALRFLQQKRQGVTA